LVAVRVGLLLIATNKYNGFVSALVKSVKEHFFTEDEVTIYLFSDRDHPDLTVFPIPSYRFPRATLYRYHTFATYAEDLKADYLFYCDVDMRFVAPVGRDILPDGINDDGLVAVEHPGFFLGGGSWETRPESTAFVPPHMRVRYYAGGFNGGERESFLTMAEELAEKIRTDEANGIIACWHDESHLNAYLASLHPRTLSPSYCYPEHLDLGWNITPKIYALLKDHREIRQ
jgi:hypothetical protein